MTAIVPGWVPGSVCVFEMVECLRMAVDAAVDAAQAAEANHASEVAEGRAAGARRCSGLGKLILRDSASDFP